MAVWGWVKEGSALNDILKYKMHNAPIYVYQIYVNILHKQGNTFRIKWNKTENFS
jgi:hypothetical protein